MDCAKGRAVAGLYDELMLEILSRVPVKDVRRSTCVSKPWRDLITDPIHRKKLPQTLEGFFHGGAGGRSRYGHFTSLSGSGESVPPVDPSFSFLTAKLPGVKRMVLLHSCNGLLLFGCIREDKFGYIVCNPATEELVTVPASSASCPPPPPLDLDEGYYEVVDDWEERFAYTFLMFDPAVSWHFHLVQIWENNSMMEVETVHSYSSETRAWTDRSSKWKRGEEGGEWGLWGKAVIKLTCGALVNGLLHFVVFQEYENLIVAVDGEGKTCRILDWPDKHELADATFIGQSQGHLHCIGVNMKSRSSQYITQLSVWVLEDYDTQEWILKHNVSTLQLFGLLSCPIDWFGIVAMHPDHNLIILVQHCVAMHPDHNLIILVQHSDQKLVSYNMDSKELRALRTLGEGDLLITPYVPCFVESSVLASKD